MGLFWNVLYRCLIEIIQTVNLFQTIVRCSIWAMINRKRLLNTSPEYIRLVSRLKTMEVYCEILSRYDFIDTDNDTEYQAMIDGYCEGQNRD